MGSGDMIDITLTGGAPWGFRLTGGDDAPLQVAKVRKKSKAHGGGVQEGDVLVSVNGKSVEGQSHMATMDMVDNSGDKLNLALRRGMPLQAIPQPQAQQTHQVTVSPAPPSAGQETVTLTTSTVSMETNTSITNGDPSTVAPTGTYSETLLGREAKLLKEDRKVEKCSMEEYSVEQQAIPTSTVTATPIPTKGTSLIDDALSKLESFPKVTDAFTSSSESFAQASIVHEQVASVFPTETVTAELKEDYKENIAPIQLNDYSHSNTGPVPIPTFHVKQVDVTKSVWQPASSSFDNRQHHQQQHRGPSLIDLQKNSFQKQAPPTPPKPKPKPNRQNIQGHPMQPIQPMQEAQQFRPSPAKVIQPPSPIDQAVSPKHGRKARHVFGPPVQISLGQGQDHLDPAYTGRAESEISSPDSSITKSKKLFSDSAFYDDPNAVYPTIDEQIDLCKIIAQSLTSNANKKARGARMFAKRVKRAPKWVHDGRFEETSSGGDVGTIEDLDSELSADEGGSKPLFTFKIPKVARQTSEPGKMSLTPDEFEKLRLDTKRCEHKTVSPNTCFNLVADLQSHKGRGAKIFEKRREKSEAWVVDETNVSKTPERSPLSPTPGRLADMLNSPRKPSKSPWEAALDNPYGSVDAAFDHLSDYERMQLANRNQPFAPMEPVPVPVPTHSKLPPGEQAALLQGPNFNRTARGWMPMDDGKPLEDLGIDFSRIKRNPPAPQVETQSSSSRQQVQYGDYNQKARSWKGPNMSDSRPHQQQQSSYSHTSSSSTVSYGGSGGRWPTSPTPDSYTNYPLPQPYSMSQSMHQSRGQQPTLFGTDL